MQPINLELPKAVLAQARLRFRDSRREGRAVADENCRSYCVVALSRVGFNLNHTRAVIDVELQYFGLCGGGQYYYLAKGNGAWRVIDLAGTWIS